MARYQGKYVRKSRFRWGSALLVVLLIVFVGMIAVGVWMLRSEKTAYDVGTSTYASLAEEAVQPLTEDAALYLDTLIVDPAAPKPEQETPSADGTPTASAPVYSLDVDFEMLLARNDQTVGWITGCGGAIHYPVMQAGDNDYYLNHLFDGTVNGSGSIFMDCRNVSDLSDRNTLIYGHNMQNGAMFAPLVNYGSQSYYDQHPALTLVTPYGTYSLQAFSGYVTPGTSESYQMYYTDDADFAAYLEMICSKSNFTPKISVTAQDTIVTLSTCTYDYEDARYVLHCKLVPMQ